MKITIFMLGMRSRVEPQDKRNTQCVCVFCVLWMPRAQERGGEAAKHKERVGLQGKGEDEE